METYELYHHGIKGMRWGIRRTKAQLGYKTNPTKKKVKSIRDQTNEQIKRIKAQGKADSKIARAEKKAADRIAKAEAKYLPKKQSESVPKPKSKSLSEMSDDEIRERINRIRLENELKSLTPKQLSKGQKFVSSIATNVVGPAAREAGRRLMTDYLSKKGSELLGLKKETVEDAATKLRKEVSYLQDLQKKDVLTKYFDEKQSKTDDSGKSEVAKKQSEKQAAKDAKAAEKQTNAAKKQAEKDIKKQVEAAKKQVEAVKKQADEARKRAEKIKKQADEFKKQADEFKKKAEEARKQANTAGSNTSYDYTVSGTGTSKRKAQKVDVIDVDYWSSTTVSDASRSSQAALGRSYIDSMFALPYRER